MSLAKANSGHPPHDWVFTIFLSHFQVVTRNSLRSWPSIRAAPALRGAARARISHADRGNGSGSAGPTASYAPSSQQPENGPYRKDCQHESADEKPHPGHLSTDSVGCLSTSRPRKLILLLLHLGEHAVYKCLFIGGVPSRCKIAAAEVHCFVCIGRFGGTGPCEDIRHSLANALADLNQ